MEPKAGSHRHPLGAVVQRLVYGLVVFAAVVGVLTAVGAQLQLIAQPDTVSVSDTSGDR